MTLVEVLVVTVVLGLLAAMSLVTDDFPLVPFTRTRRGMALTFLLWRTYS